MPGLLLHHHTGKTPCYGRRGGSCPPFLGNTIISTQVVPRLSPATVAESFLHIRVSTQTLLCSALRFRESSSTTRQRRVVKTTKDPAHPEDSARTPKRQAQNHHPGWPELEITIESSLGDIIAVAICRLPLTICMYRVRFQCVGTHTKQAILI